jgi:hypothetical protein
VNVAAIFKAIDAIIAFRDATRRFKEGSSPPPPPEAAPAAASSHAQGLSGQIEARLTNVVVAALKEAFDRDHARLELERAQMEEDRRRTAAALQAELRRQAMDREIGRLRLLVGGAMVGWIASVAILAGGLAGASVWSRVVLAIGWLLLLGTLGTGFTAQAKIGAVPPGESRSSVSSGGWGIATLWLLITGLAATAISLLV